MIFSTKSLTDSEKEICLNTVSSRAIFAMVGDAIMRKQSLSVVRMGDGEKRILEADPAQPFTEFNSTHDEWNTRLGIAEMPVGDLQKNIIEAGNTCTHFAPSISGISMPKYFLYDFFQPRDRYFDNFFVNDWTKDMIRMLFEASGGVFIIHREYQKIIQNFQANYSFTKEVTFDGCTKDNWTDNQAAIEAASESSAQLILFSAGPGGKIIGPRIAQAENKIVIDVGNTLLPWSEKKV